MALLVMNAVVLGSLKIGFPRKQALKIEGTIAYVLYKGHWVSFNPTTDLFFKHGFVKVLLNNKYIVIHLNEHDYQRLAEILRKDLL
jgi:hypothetical protein